MSDTITDLTGTIWLFNDTIDVAHNLDYFINFEVPEYEQYSLLSLQPVGRAYVLKYDTVPVYSTYGGWNNIYKTITITGGTDATNQDLISWLQSNATQIIEEEPISSFNELEVIEHTDYITLTIQGNTINIAKGVTSNFELLNGDYLETSDGNIFEATEVN